MSGVATKSRATTFEEHGWPKLNWVYNSGSDYKHNNISEVLCYKVGLQWKLCRR